MRRLASRVLIAALLASLTTAVSTTAALAADAPVVVLGFASPGWAYKQVPYDGEAGFEALGFDDTAWAVGQAGFGTTDGVCPWNTTERVHTAWDPGTDMLLRHRFTLPAGASGVHISGTVDNNADVYVNGTLVQHVESGFCTADGINADVPDAAIGQDNVVAIRGRDLGSATFIDVQVTYSSATPPPPPPPPTALHAGQFIDVVGAPPAEPEGTIYQCTAGFAVAKGTTRYLLSTAHCLDHHTIVNVWEHAEPHTWTTAFATMIGCNASQVLIACLAPVRNGLDNTDYFAWQPDESYLPDALVMTGKDLQPVLGESIPLAGEQVCHYGEGTNGERCGEMVLTDRYGDYGTKAYAVPGDSGGPAYQYVKAGKKIIGVKAVGIVVQGQYVKPNGKTAAGSTIIPMGTIESALGVSLLTM
jgi:hypothetical protein